MEDDAAATTTESVAAAAGDAPRRQSHHIPMESKVLGGFVQPGLAMMAAQSTESADRAPSESRRSAERAAAATASDSESDDEAIPALAHLEEQSGGGRAGGKRVSGGGMVADYVFEEKTFEFETKPMGFQIEAENGKISVRSVRALSAAGQFGVEPKWDIVAVNGFRSVFILKDGGPACYRVVFLSVFLILSASE